MPISYTNSAEEVNWPQLRDDLVKDHFHNGRTAEELARSFANSYACKPCSGPSMLHTIVESGASCPDSAASRPLNLCCKGVPGNAGVLRLTGSTGPHP